MLTVNCTCGETMELIDTIEAGQIIGVQEARILAYIREKRLPAAKLGRVWVILRHNAKAFKRGKPGIKTGSKQGGE